MKKGILLLCSWFILHLMCLSYFTFICFTTKISTYCVSVISNKLRTGMGVSSSLQTWQVCDSPRLSELCHRRLPCISPSNNKFVIYFYSTGISKQRQTLFYEEFCHLPQILYLQYSIRKFKVQRRGGTVCRNSLSV